MGPKATQVIRRSQLGGMSGASSELLRFVSLLADGEPSESVYTLACDEASRQFSNQPASIFILQTTDGNQVLRPVASAHGAAVEEPPQVDTNIARFFEAGLLAIEIVSFGVRVGLIVVNIADKSPAPESIQQLKFLAHFCSAAFERERNGRSMQNLLDRLDVLSQLNSLVASNLDLNRVLKTLARESAFRFSADIAVTLMLSEDKQHLIPKGGYGLTASDVPASLSLKNGVLSQVMHLGGHISIQSLEQQNSNGLEFLEGLGIVSLDLCCLEVQGQPLGALVNGYRRSNTLNGDELGRFEEFCRGAAITISNAHNQEQVKVYTERLEHLVTERTKQLEIASQRAEDANEAKSRFLANMSHELRTPLTAIVGYSSVLADGIFGELTDKQKDALNAVVRSSEHLKSLIDDVLNLARIESGKENPEPKRVALGELMMQCYKLMMQTAQSKDVKLSVPEIPPELQKCDLYVDPKHIVQIIINLLSNSIKYTPQGGKVWMKISPKEDRVEIAIHDTGVGLSATKKAKLFDRFERGEDSYSKSQEGTGIGLNLTKQLVEINGGRIGVESEEGVGSVFWILVPQAIEVEKQASVDSVDVKVVARLDGLSALVVDDNPDSVMVLTTVLTAAGADVIGSGTVAEALVELQKKSFDVILTDLAMPGESGTNLVSRLRNKGDKVPIIVLSACAFEADKQEALDAGASAFMPKPFRPKEVVQMIRTLTLSSAIGN